MMTDKTETQKAIETVQVAKDSLEAMAANIAIIAEAARKMMQAGLKEETLILLLHDQSGVKKRDIKLGLRSLQNLNYYRGK